MRTTRVPEVIDRVRYVLESKVDAETTQVLDGPSVSGDYKDVVFLIGFRPDRQDDWTTTRRGPDGLVHNDREFFVIGGLINAVDGTGSVQGARDKGVAALAVLEGILTTSDPALGLGDGVKVRLAEYAGRAIPTTKGIEQTISWLIEGQALL